MKKNRFISASLAASFLLFAACSNEVESVSNPDQAGADEAVVKVSFQLPSTLPSYAVGDAVGEGIAKDSEKEIRDIAFFAFTTGGNAVCLSTEPMLTANGFTQPLLPVGDATGNYTASFKIRSALFAAKTPIYAVANYKDNGLFVDEAGNITEATKAITLHGLKTMLSNPLAADASINTPLLMTCSLEDNDPEIAERPNSAVEIKEGATVAVNFVMERIVSRIDVVNNAYNATTPTDNFELVSARLLSAPAKAALFIGETVSAPTYINTGYQETVAIGGTELLPTQVLAPMYVNPGDNVDAATATHIEVVGNYKNSVFRKKIAFKTADALVGDEVVLGEIVPMRRNYRYIVNINKSAESEDLQFNVTVKDWDEAEEIIIKPSMKAPKLENFVLGNGGNAGAKWDEPNTTLTLTLTEALTAAVVLTFDASAFQAPKASLSIAEGSSEFIKIGDITLGELTGYASESVASKTTDVTPDAEEPMPLKRKFTLTIPTTFNEKIAIKTGFTHTNTLNIMVTEGFVTPITIKYVDNRLTPAP